MNVLITGASGGIGRAIARKLMTKGNTLFLHYYENDTAVFKLVEEAEQAGVAAVAVQADLSTTNGVDILISRIYTNIDLLIHNSGLSHVGLMTDMDDQLVERMVQLHITSPFQLTKALLPAMINKKQGKIIVISSIWGITGASCEVLYSMVKGGQNAFVKALAKETGPSGITVNAVAPGAVETKMMADFSEEDKKLITDEIPLGRLATADEIADAVLFLAGPNSSYISGQILSVNGAWYC